MDTVNPSHHLTKEKILSKNSFKNEESVSYGASFLKTCQRNACLNITIKLFFKKYTFRPISALGRRGKLTFRFRLISRKIALPEDIRQTRVMINVWPGLLRSL